MSIFLPNHPVLVYRNKASIQTDNFHSFKLSKSFIIGVLLVVVCLGTKGTTITSIQAGGNWNSPSTWVGGVIPNSNDDVITNGSGGNSVTLQNDITVKSLTLVEQGGIIAGNFNLTIKENLTIGNFVGGKGLSRDNGTITVGGNFTYTNYWAGANQLGGGTQAGYLVMNGSTFSITSNQPLSIPYFRVGNATLTITINNSQSLFISKQYDRNCLPSPTFVGAFNAFSTIGDGCIPTISVTKTTLSGFSYGIGFGPSTEQTYIVSGSYLLGDILITAPTNYEISTISGSYNTTPLTLPKSGGGIVLPTTIYVRLKSGLALGQYNSKTITHTSTYATTITTCNGSVNCISPPTVVTSPITLCQNTTAAALEASGTNIKWVDFGSGSVGGTNAGTENLYTDKTWSNWALMFTTKFSNITLNSVDVYSSNNNTATNCIIGIYNNSGVLLTSTAFIMPASTSNIKYTVPFNYLITTAGDYSLRFTPNSGPGSFGNIISTLNSSSNVNINGNFDYSRNQSTSINIYNNLQFTYNNQSTIPPTPSTTTVGSTTYYVTQSNGSCTSGMATIEVNVINNCLKYFRSNVSTGNWNDIGTWQQSFNGNQSWVPATTYPTNTDGPVTIRTGNTVNVVTNRDETASSLTITGTGNLTIQPGACLTVDGAITTTNNDQIYIQSSAGSSNGSLIFPTAKDVQATVEMYSMGYKSYDPDLSGQYYKWQYFGIPINKIVASPTFDGFFVRKWVESGKTIEDHWVSINNSFELQPGIGYEVTQNDLVGKKIFFKGQLVNSNVPSGKLPYTLGAKFPGQNILANPFTAAIDISKIDFGLNFGSDMQQAFWLFTTGSIGDWVQNTNQYTVVLPNPIGLGMITQIPSMQGMLVQFKQDIIASSDKSWVNIPYGAVMKNIVPQRVKASTDSSSLDKMGMRIDVTGLKSSDKMWLFSNSSCTRNFDNGWDGAKIMGSSLAPQIFAIEPDNNYQVDAVSDINNTQLGFQAGEDIEYTLTFTYQNLLSKYTGVYLLDLLENKTVEITESGSTYSFAAETTPTPVKRFKIVTRPYEKDTPDATTQIKVFSSGNTVFVQNSGNLNGEITLYDMTGRTLKKSTFGPYGITALQIGSISGAYVVKAYTSNENVSKRIILGKE